VSQTKISGSGPGAATKILPRGRKVTKHGSYETDRKISGLMSHSAYTLHIDDFGDCLPNQSLD